jgi:hypothetical protein
VHPCEPNAAGTWRTRGSEQKGIRFQVLNLDVIEPISPAPRQIMPERSQEERVADPAAEIALGYSEELALIEAKRCLQCGLIGYRRNGEGLH